MAIKVLEYDINMSKLRSKLVNSKKITDEKFWKNYFYHVEVIKCKYHMINSLNEVTHENISIN